MSCSFVPGKCSILDVAILGNPSEFVCGYENDRNEILLCNPGCCPSGIAKGFDFTDMQPEPICKNRSSCDAEYSGKMCKPHTLENGELSCGYIESGKFIFCNPGCNACKGTKAVGPCPGTSKQTPVSFGNTPPAPYKWGPQPDYVVNQPIIHGYFYAIIILLIALAIASSVALI